MIAWLTFQLRAVQALTAEARREAMALQEEAALAGKTIRRMEMEASMGPWIK